MSTGSGIAPSCMTCADAASAATVTSIDEAQRLMTVTDEHNATHIVDSSLLDDVNVGDGVLIHGGVALVSLGAMQR